jgi:hypothetical protein
MPDRGCVRRWCENCRRYTRSFIWDGDELCAEHEDVGAPAPGRS